VRDVFRTPSATLRFTRDDDGRITGCIWNGGRIRGFRLIRQPAVGPPAAGAAVAPARPPE